MKEPTTREEKQRKDSPKTDPTLPQDRSMTAPPPRLPQDRSKTAPKQPKTASRLPQERSEDRPRPPKTATRTPQDRSKTAPKPPQTAPRPPQDRLFLSKIQKRCSDGCLSPKNTILHKKQASRIAQKP